MSEQITVIIPVYQAESFLDRCLKSIVNQEYRNLRVLLVEDCSKDNSREICKKWVEKDSRFELIALDKNGGAANARNMGLDNASFDEGYIAFVDADDYLHPSYFTYLYDLLKKNDADFSWCGVHNTFETEKMEFADLSSTDNEYTISGKDLLTREDLRIMYSMVWGKLFRSKLWKDIRFDTKYSYYEDGGTTFKVIYNASLVAISQRPLYNYFYSVDSATRSSVNETKLRDGIETELDKIRFYTSKNEAELLEMAYVAYLNTLLKCCREVKKNLNNDSLYREFFYKYKANYMRCVKNTSLPISQRMKYLIYRICPGVQEYYIKLKMKVKGY